MPRETMLRGLLDRIRNYADRPEDDDERLIRLAAATLLIEVAWADHDITDEEIVLVEHALASQFDLDPAQIDELIAESRQTHEESVGLYAFTRTLVEAWDEPRRFELVTLLWRLAFADQKLDRFEEHMIRKIAELLYLSHGRFIEAKRKARSTDS